MDLGMDGYLFQPGGLKRVLREWVLSAVTLPVGPVLLAGVTGTWRYQVLGETNGLLSAGAPAIDMGSVLGGNFFTAVLPALGAGVREMVLNTGDTNVGQMVLGSLADGGLAAGSHPAYKGVFHGDVQFNVRFAPFTAGTIRLRLVAVPLTGDCSWNDQVSFSAPTIAINEVF